MHAYRTHNCAELRQAQVGESVRLSGWVHRKRDHGNLLFVDLRDHYGITQIVTDVDAPAFAALDKARVESVLTVTGDVVARSPETVNANLPTGEIELRAREVTVQSPAAELPMPVAGEQEYPEDIRLKYRYLDLRRDRLHANVMLRSNVIASLRRRMVEQGFTEFQTPILTASSPEGARDYLVPSRVHPGKFYALPQAPQMFKQLLMVAGFDRYFQIAPCFRDEDARADRSPGEFYQLDFEMSFVTQEDVFQAIEPVLAGVFEEFAERQSNRSTPVSPGQFPRIPYARGDAEIRQSDKPDLRNPLLIIGDVTEPFSRRPDSGCFEKIHRRWRRASCARSPRPERHEKSRKFFDEMNDWARRRRLCGARLRHAQGRRIRRADRQEPRRRKDAGDLCRRWDSATDDGAVLRRGQGRARPPGSPALARTGSARSSELIDPGRFKFCWIVDFPMFEYDEEREDGSISATIPSPCRRAKWKRCRTHGPARYPGLAI